MPLDPPSAFLPALKNITNSSEQAISDAISRLRLIYLPQIRGSTRRRPSINFPAFQCSHGRPKSTDMDNNIDSIQNDAFERSFSIQWLTRFISVYSECDIGARMGGRGDILEEAASLLAVCAGTAACGNIIR